MRIHTPCALRGHPRSLSCLCKKVTKEAPEGRTTGPSFRNHLQRRGSRPMKRGSNHVTAEHSTQVLCGEPTWLREVHRRWPSLEGASQGETGVSPWVALFAYFLSTWRESRRGVHAQCTGRIGKMLFPPCAAGTQPSGNRKRVLRGLRRYIPQKSCVYYP